MKLFTVVIVEAESDYWRQNRNHYL